MKEYDMINPMHFKECIRGKKIYLFGSGNVGQLALQDAEIRDLIIGVVDNASERWGKKFGEFVIQSPAILMNTDAVVLITCQYLYDIREQLEWLNVAYYFHYETLRHIEKTNRDVRAVEAVESFINSEHYKLWEKESYYAHACGLIEGIKYTNCKEALVHSYELGARVFEIDLTKDADGTIYACHGGDYFEKIVKCYGEREQLLMSNAFNLLDDKGYPIDLHQFQKEKVYGKYTVLLWEDILAFMEAHKDVFFLLHTRGKSEEYLTCLHGIDITIRKRFVMQLTATQANYVSDLRGMGIELIHLIDDFYCKLEARYTNNELIRTCVQNGLGVLVVGKRRADDNLIQLARQNGIKLGVYAEVNEWGTITSLKKRGVSIFCVDDYECAMQAK